MVPEQENGHFFSNTFLKKKKKRGAKLWELHALGTAVSMPEQECEGGCIYTA